MYRRYFIFITLIYLFNIVPAQAMLIKYDWLNEGDGLLVHDSDTNLRWLKLTQTLGMSYDYVTAQLSEGGLFDGFRVGTSSEVVTLFDNFGIDLSPNGPLGGDGFENNISAAGEAIGFHSENIEFTNSDIPFSSYQNYYVLGLTSDNHWESPGAKDMVGVARRIEIYREPTLEPNIFNFFDPPQGPGGYLPTQQEFGRAGIYLVSPSPVPEPSTIFLFIFGLIGIVCRRFSTQLS